MSKYNFSKNVEKHILKEEEKEKKEIIGNILAGLQKPASDVLDLLVSKQIQDLSNLLFSVTNKNKKIWEK